MNQKPKKATSFFHFTREKKEVTLRILILIVISLLAFLVRLFSVLRFESVIHEFDPHFNYRSTLFLIREGFYKFLTWFDEFSWYPLGRNVGSTVFPGIMFTAATLFWIIKNVLRIAVEIRNVCVMMGPFFASLTAISTYFFTTEVTKKPRAGLIAATFISLVPGYMSRSVAGSFDNECIAIFALVFTFYLWVKSVNTGSLFFSLLTAISYLYMVASWGGYVFIINLIPLYTLVMLLLGRFSKNLYIAYNITYVIGSLLSMQVTWVGYLPVQSSEHMAGLGVFGLLQLYGGYIWIQSLLPQQHVVKFIKILGIFTVVTSTVGLIIATFLGYVSPWGGRFYSLLDPTYAKENIPIIASVSEHQPTAWGSYFFDLHILIFLFPAGIYFCIKELNDGKIFLILYALTSAYFSGVMVRLMLVLAPISCVLGAISVTELLDIFSKYYHQSKEKEKTEKKEKKEKEKENSFSEKKKKTSTKMKVKQKSKQESEDFHIGEVASLVAIILFMSLLFAFMRHSIWAASEAYSSPSVVLAAKGHQGEKIIFDDFREAYYWLRQNTPDSAKIMSWWDYGYQITSMANRTVLVDNNTWNNSHIGTVGKMLALSENESYPLLVKHDVDYVLVLFGGVVGYSSDDINKFLWPVRIAGSVDPAVKEDDYLNSRKQFRVDKEGAPKFLDSLMYKMVYYRFGQVTTDPNRPPGFDRVRNTVIGRKDFTLEHLEEAFTTEHWIVRIYKVLKPSNRR